MTTTPTTHLGLLKPTPGTGEPWNSGLLFSQDMDAIDANAAAQDTTLTTHTSQLAGLLAENDLTVTNDLASLGALPAQTNGATREVLEGGAIWQYSTVTSKWSQITPASFASAATRTSAYAKGITPTTITLNAQCRVVRTDVSGAMQHYTGTSTVQAWTYDAEAVPLMPTAGSATGSGSTLTVAGSVSSFTNCTQFTLGPIFSAEFDDYRVVLKIASGTAATTVAFRLAGSAGSLASAVYSYGGVTDPYNSASLAAIQAVNDSSGPIARVNAASGPGDARLELINPFLAVSKFFHFRMADNAVVRQGSGAVADATSWDRLNVQAQTGSISGTVQVFGITNS